MSWVTDLLEEVALEGLDGITLNTLWIRLEKRYGFQFDVRDPKVCAYLWRAVLCNPKASSFLFYELPEDRPPFVFNDRFEHISDTGMFIEDNEVPSSTPYLFNVVVGRSVKGSCRNIDDRRDITEEIYLNRATLNDVNVKYGNKLVVVADQHDRNKALGIYDIDPFMFISDRIYCFLEVVGRCRDQGLPTIGSDSGLMGIDPKTSFYYRKFLLKKRLISRSHYHLIMKGRSGISKGSLLFLSRFHKKILSPIEITAAKVSNILENEVDHECEYTVMRDRVEATSRKIFKYVFDTFTGNFDVFMKSEMKQNDPNQITNRKTIRLIKPFDIDADDKDDHDGDETDAEGEDFDDGVDVCDGSLQKARLFDPTRILADRTLLSQVLMAIESSEAGLSLADIGTQLQLTKLDARLVAKFLEKTGLVKVGREEIGKVRFIKYFSVYKLPTNGIQDDLQITKLDTARKVSRAKIILNYLRNCESQTVFGIYPFVKEIRSQEEDTGKICDPKTVRRMLLNLQEDSKLRVHEFEKTFGDKNQTLVVVTLPNVPSDDPSLTERIDNYIFSMNNKLVASQTRKHKKAAATLTTENLEEFKYNPSIGKKQYGGQAKMRKIFTLYKFLFHQLWSFSRKGRPVNHSDWRDFVTPMSGNKNLKVSTLRDLIPRIPVSIFCRIVYITHEIPGLYDILHDPTQQNLPLNQMSPEILKGLMLGRKYIYNILTLLTSLTTMGLVQLENADAINKDDIRVKVLNKITWTHVDSTEKFTFTSVEDIERFEEELALHCVSSDETCDCSLPKNLFAHQTRNWSDVCNIKPSHVLTSKRSIHNIGLEILDPVDVEPIQTHEISTRQKRQREPATILSSPKRKRRRTVQVAQSQAQVPEQSDPARKKRKPKMDDKDKYALSILNRKRCIWTQQEDNFLLLCRVATLLLGQIHLMYINPKIVRDELHRLIPTSENKTKHACQRRVLYMLKDHRTRQNVLDWLSEFRQDDAFADIVIPTVPKTNEEIWDDAFRDALSKVLSKFVNLNARDDVVETVLKLDEESIHQYDLLDYADYAVMKRTPVFIEPKNRPEICVNTFENVLISSLLMMNEGTSIEEYSHVLYKIYRRFPDSLIRSVVAKLKKNNVMAFSKKSYQDPSVLKCRGMTPYKLSQHYAFLLQTKYAIETLIEKINLSSAFGEREGRIDTAVVVSLLTSRSARFCLSIPEDFISLDKDHPFAKTPHMKVPRDTMVSSEKRSSSRSVLYAFREHLSLNTKQPRDKIQDYLVLNKCSVSVESTIKDPLEQTFLETFKFVCRNLNKVPAPEPATINKDLIQFIRSHKEMGCRKSDIEGVLNCFPEDELIKLESSQVIHRVGVNAFRWVHRDFLVPWIVRSIFSTQAKSHATKRQLREVPHDIEYVAKVWRKPDGQLDSRIMYKFMAAIIGHVMTYPGISEASILDHFRICAPATQLREILELLVTAGCLKLSMISATPKISLFEPVCENSCALVDVAGGSRLNDDSLATKRYFEVAPNGILILSQIRTELAQTSGEEEGNSGDVSSGSK